MLLYVEFQVYSFHNQMTMSMNKAREIRAAANYIEAVRQVAALAPEECKIKGAQYVAFSKLYWRKPFIAKFLPDKKRRAVVFEFCTLDLVLAQCRMDVPNEYRPRIQDIRDELWVRMDALGKEKLQHLAATLTPTSFDDIVGRLKEAVEADALALYRKFFVPARKTLQSDVALVMPDAPKNRAETYLFDFAFRDSKECRYVTDSDCWNHTNQLDTPEKRHYHMMFHHLTLAGSTLERLLKERDQRRLAAAMALHERLGAASGLGGFSACLMEALLNC